MIMKELLSSFLLLQLASVDAVPIFQEMFETPDSFGSFTAVDVEQPGVGWNWVLWNFGATGAVQGNGFGGSGPTEDWLITSQPVNLAFVNTPSLTYGSQQSFSGPINEVRYSTDYDPSTMVVPGEATWTTLYQDTSATDDFSTQGPFDMTGIDQAVYIAFFYSGTGGGGGQSSRWTIDDVVVDAVEPFYNFAGEEDQPIADSTPWTVVDLASDFQWFYDTRNGEQAACGNNFGSAGGAADDWLISPSFAASSSDTSLFKLDYYENFDDTIGMPLTILVTDSWTGDVETTSWTDITPEGLNGSTSDAFVPISTNTFQLSGSDVRLAFRYQASGTAGGATKRICVDKVALEAVGGPLVLSEIAFGQEGSVIGFFPQISGGTPPFAYSWDFADGNTSTEAQPTNRYTAAGDYNVMLTVEDSSGGSVESSVMVSVTKYEVPVKQAGNLRIATFNMLGFRANLGDFAKEVMTGDSQQLKYVAGIIQNANPDVILLNEIDQVYNDDLTFDLETSLGSLQNFAANYVEVEQTPGSNPVKYEYLYIAPCNTGVPSGFDLDNNGVSDGPGDGFGFGVFPSQYAMAFMSKYPILEEGIRTFQYFRWMDMPDAYLPPDPSDSDSNGDLTSYYTAEELEVFRLSSKSHWDIPIVFENDVIVHALGSHPTPPVFDDGTATIYPSTEVADWNGLRNHDEIRFWADYIDPTRSAYFYDDNEFIANGFMTPANPSGGLAPCSRFVILGDQNADPVDGDATFDAALQITDHPLVDGSVVPVSTGALEQVPDTQSLRETKTADFNLRADYALPSKDGFEIQEAFVFWPISTDIEFEGLKIASDHRLVFVDLAIRDLTCGSEEPPVDEEVGKCRRRK